jgi:hypothetical protein
MSADVAQTLGLRSLRRLARAAVARPAESGVTGQEERMVIVTTLLRDSRLLYALVVAPRDHFDQYEPTFRRVVSSIAIIE